MTSEALHVIIDERNRPRPVEAKTLVVTRRILTATRNAQHRVFKDYILSSDTFYVELP
jgi:hypothetical protein